VDPIKDQVLGICSAFVTGHRLGLISKDLPDPIHQTTRRYKTVAEQEAYRLGVAAGYEKATVDDWPSRPAFRSGDLHMLAPGEVASQRVIDFILESEEAAGSTSATLEKVCAAIAMAGILYRKEKSGRVVISRPEDAIRAMATEIALLKTAMVHKASKRFCASGSTISACEIIYNATLALDKAGVPDTFHAKHNNPHAVAQRIETLAAQRDAALAEANPKQEHVQ
jgi:hypothetical protein